jgi:hypothetical protein
MGGYETKVCFSMAIALTPCLSPPCRSRIGPTSGRRSLLTYRSSARLDDQDASCHRQAGSPPPPSGWREGDIAWRSSSTARRGGVHTNLKADDHERVTLHRCRVGMSRITIIQAETPALCAAHHPLACMQGSTLTNPTLNRLTLHDFRGYKATCASLLPLLPPAGRRQCVTFRLACTCVAHPSARRKIIGVTFAR